MESCRCELDAALGSGAAPSGGAPQRHMTRHSRHSRHSAACTACLQVVGGCEAGQQRLGQLPYLGVEQRRVVACSRRRGRRRRSAWTAQCRHSMTQRGTACAGPSIHTCADAVQLAVEGHDGRLFARRGQRIVQRPHLEHLLRVEARVPARVRSEGRGEQRKRGRVEEEAAGGVEGALAN